MCIDLVDDGWWSPNITAQVVGEQFKMLRNICHMFPSIPGCAGYKSTAMSEWEVSSCMVHHCLVIMLQFSWWTILITCQVVEQPVTTIQPPWYPNNQQRFWPLLRVDSWLLGNPLCARFDISLRAEHVHPCVEHLQCERNTLDVAMFRYLSVLTHIPYNFWTPDSKVVPFREKSAMFC